MMTLRWFKTVAIRFALVWLMPALAPHASGQDETPTIEILRPSVIVVFGAVGDKTYADDFTTTRELWQSKSLPHLTILPDAASGDPTKAQLLTAIKAADGNQPLWLILIGHGTADSSGSGKFNLDGPDISDVDLLDALPTNQPQVLAACFSSSSPFLTRSPNPNRVVISATQNTSEQNYARFGQFFSQRLFDSSADIDHDEAVSILEAFLAASADVEKFYAAADRLTTEHAIIDDTGDGRGTPASFFDGIRIAKKAKDNAAVDGMAANSLFLIPSVATENLKLSPSQRADQLAIELAVENLRAQKTEMPVDEYYNELELLFRRLADIVLPEK